MGGKVDASGPDARRPRLWLQGGFQHPGGLTFTNKLDHLTGGYLSFHQQYQMLSATSQISSASENPQQTAHFYVTLHIQTRTNGACVIYIILTSVVRNGPPRTLRYLEI